ncbi:hypothetical protein B9Z33_02795 [Limnohabitans sp. T6-20]|nr:hypothetical protein B9Z33_02795 [Limnohabitans sp. T6-20]
MNTPVKKRYLTKSRFKLALECPTKLYYAAESNGYFDKNKDNDFLQALADGGNQVGELAKFKYHPNPVGDAITVETLQYDAALTQTHAKLSLPGRVVVAEAALLYAPYFVRVDILIRDKEAKTIDIIEVKSKSIDDDTVTARFKNSSNQYATQWLPYLYDVTFQAEVARLNFPGYKIRPKLLLLDAAKACDKDGLHQLFQIVQTKNAETGVSRVQIKTPPHLTEKDIGNLDFLREVDVRDIVDELRHMPIDNVAHVPEIHRQDLATFMKWAGELQMQGHRVFHGVSKTCRTCQYRAPAGNPLRSGVHECWQLALSQGLLQGGRDLTDRNIPLSIELWGGASGSRSFADVVLKQGRAFLADVQEDDIRPKAQYGGKGMSPLERRMAQVQAANGQGPTFVLDEERLSEMDDWQWPLHMIDFETSAPALPFFKNMRPYQTLAFQFSHHIMEKLGDRQIRIRHANQWISTQAGFFPSIEFVRQLRKALMPSGQLEGTVFRYHNHENTVLRGLRKTIEDAGLVFVPDATELIAFIDLITKSTGDEAEIYGPFAGERAMVDLHRLIQEGYYSAKAGGSISLKFMLPAILHDAPGVAALYREHGVYGAGLAIESLNFKGSQGHVWLQTEKGNDPYKTLPGIFSPEHGDLNEMLLRLAGDEDDEGAINQGGLAMTAYNYTQFNGLSAAERQSIEQALLRYCELDTLAMVMLVQGLMSLRDFAA